MSFTTPCFIRKNTPELRKRLEELGYKCGSSYSHLNEDFNSIIVTTGTSYFIVGNTEAIEWYNQIGIVVIDCGANEELFLAIAALRDDSDYMQWFCIKREFPTKYEHFKLCAEQNWNTFRAKNEIMDHMYFGYHKATIQELIKHFSKT